MLQAQKVCLQGNARAARKVVMKRSFVRPQVQDVLDSVDSAQQATFDSKFYTDFARDSLESIDQRQRSKCSHNQGV